MYGLSDELAAFYFDRAVTAFGKEVEEALSDAADGAKNKKDGKRRQQLAFAKFMRNPDGSSSPGTYKDPSAASR